MTIFRVKSVKIYTGQKKFTRVYPWRLWQISGMMRNYVFPQKCGIYFSKSSTKIIVQHKEWLVQQGALWCKGTISTRWPLLEPLLCNCLGQKESGYIRLAPLLLGWPKHTSQFLIGIAHSKHQRDLQIEENESLCGKTIQLTGQS